MSCWKYGLELAGSHLKNKTDLGLPQKVLKQEEISSVSQALNCMVTYFSPFLNLQKKIEAVI